MCGGGGDCLAAWVACLLAPIQARGCGGGKEGNIVEGVC